MTDLAGVPTRGPTSGRRTPPASKTARS